MKDFKCETWINSNKEYPLKVLTTCPFCGCGCGVFLEVENGRVIGSSPERFHPSSQGTLCPKGWNGFQIIHHPSRLTAPLIKRNGTFHKASWEEAFQLIAERLSAIKKSSGPDAIGIIGSPKLTNETNYLLTRLARAIIRTNNLDTSARFYQAPTMHALIPMLGEGAATASITDFETADTIVLVGANAKDQNAKVGSFIIRAARDGKHFVLIDPHTIELSHFATIHLRLRPGTDAILLNALTQQVLSHKKSKNVKITAGVAEALAKFSLEYASEQTGIALESLRQAVDSITAAKKLMFGYSTGLTQHAGGTQNVRALANLALATGSIGNGGGLVPLMLANNMQGVLDLGVMPEFLPGHQPISDERSSRMLATLWDSTLAVNEGLTLGEMIEQAGNSIKALYLTGENLVWSAPNPGAAIRKLAALDFLVVQELFMTETAELAHVVLPAASFAEIDGTFTSTDRCIQRVRKAIAPPGKAKPDHEIVAEICRRLGGKSIPDDPALLFEEITRVVPMYHELNYDGLNVPGGVQRKAKVHAKLQMVKANHKKPAELPDPDYPFTLVIGRSNFHRITGTLTTRSFTLKKEFSAGVVEMNNGDADRLGLRSGWKTKIVTRRGTIVRTIQASKAVLPGLLYVPIHEAEGHTNILSNSELEAESKIPEMKVCAAKLESLT